MRLNSICTKDPKDPRTTKPHQLPIYATSSFEFDTVEEGMGIFKDPSKAHLYARFANPTVDAVAQKIADIEAFGSDVTDHWGIMTSSGMSAISTLIFSVLKSGDKILTQGNLYGGSTELISKGMAPYGIGCVLVDLRNESEVQETLSNDSSIKMIYFETPSNPVLDCIDLAKMSSIAKKYNVITAVDNTFCTPAIQRPFRHDIDYIVHSTTKYLNGHGNGISGIIIGKGTERQKKVWSTMKLIGTNCNAWDAWLTNNGLKTLHLRMERHSSNGLALANFLDQHNKVDKVHYIGLKDHPDHDLASRQMSSFGGMLAFELKANYEGAIKLMNAVKMSTMAPTMGDVDTLIMHPASMSHLNVEKSIRKANGITDGLIRLSVGIEDVEDLIEDFENALSII